MAMNDKLKKVISDLAKTKEDLQNFITKTENLAGSQLPGLKEGFGADDIFSFGGTAILKKKLNDLIDDVVNYIHERENLLFDFESGLVEFNSKVSAIAMLGDLVNFFKQKAIMLMTVHVFHAPNLDIETDDTLNRINNVIQDIGMVISIGLDVAGFPEIGVALQAMLMVVGAIFSFIEISQKIDSINGCYDKLRPAYDKVQISDNTMRESMAQIEQTFVGLKQFLNDIGNTTVTNDPRNIISEFVAVQSAFNNVYTDYEHIKPLLRQYDWTLDAIAGTYKKQTGYGVVNRYTFFLVLYAEEFLKLEEVGPFLLAHKCQVPEGGVSKLVRIVEYIATTFQENKPKNSALNKQLHGKHHARYN